MEFDEARKLALDECAAALGRISDAETKSLLGMIDASEQIFFVGVGRVFLSLQAICKRFFHLGLKAHCLGDVTEPAMTDADLLIVASGSGESLVPVAIAKKVFDMGAKIAYIGSNPKSSIAKLANLTVRIPVRTKLELADELPSEQPMTSLFEQSLLIYGDILAKLIVENKGLDMKGLWRNHANLE